MNDLALTLLLALFGSGATAAIVSGMFTRRKIGAEATEIIGRAAGDQLLRMQGEITRLEGRVRSLEGEKDTLDRKVDRLERREMGMRDLLMIHGGWDHRMQTELEKRMTPDQVEEAGLFPAPPLFPPSSTA